MKIQRKIYLLVVLIFLSTTSLAQERRIGFINAEAFAHPTGGIARLVSALESVEREFEPRLRELTEAQSRFFKLEQELRGLGPIPTDPRPMTPKRRKEAQEQIESMRRILERERRQASVAYNRRLKEVIEPIQTDIRQQMKRFAAEHGIEMLIETSSLKCLVGCEQKDVDKLDVTAEFIAEYNRLNR